MSFGTVLMDIVIIIITEHLQLQISTIAVQIIRNYYDSLKLHRHKKYLDYPMLDAYKFI